MRSDRFKTSTGSRLKEITGEYLRKPIGAATACALRAKVIANAVNAMG